MSAFQYSSALTILYASETGTAEDVAYRIHSIALRKGLQSSVESLATYNVLNLPSEEAVVAFVVSTTGDGDVPATMRRFWQFLLQRSLPKTSLEGVRVAVFGLGDSSYEKFNASARRLHKRLQQLGAVDAVPIGLGDDQARYGYLGALDQWLNELWKSLASPRKEWPSSAPAATIARELASTQTTAQYDVADDTTLTPTAEYSVSYVNSPLLRSSSSGASPGSAKEAKEFIENSAPLSLSAPPDCKLPPGSLPLVATVVENR